MPNLNPQQPISAREVINAQRRRREIVEAIFLVCEIAAVWFVVMVLEYPAEYAFLALLGFMFLSLMLNRVDVCPSCKRSISMLPSEGNLRRSELSHAIRYCPYCAADFSLAAKLAAADNSKVNPH